MKRRLKYGLCILFLSLLVFHVQAADFDGNGKVDFADFLSFASVFGSTDSHHDLNGNGKVDFPDFLIFATQFAQAANSATINQETKPKEYFVSPTGSGSSYSQANPGHIAGALRHVQPGESIRLLPGTYPRIYTSISGSADKPVTLISASSSANNYAVIDGGNTTGAKGHEGIILSDASWVTIENIKFRNCWQKTVDLRNSSYITVRGCDFREGRDIVSVSGNGSHHILIEDNYWEQNQKIWTEWHWAEIHHGNLNHYSGSLYDGRTSPGAAIIRNNHIKYVFNAFEVWSDAVNKQANNEIYGNLIEYVNDNTFEPERHTFNLHIYHNVVNQNARHIFSILHNEGDSSNDDNGPIYAYGNVGYFDFTDPLGGGSTWSPAMGIVKNFRWLRRPVYFVHNTWVYGTWGPNTWEDDHSIVHKNNIGVFKDGYSFRKDGKFTELGNVFDYDFSDKPWPKVMVNGGQEKNGIVAADPGLMNPKEGDYRLRANSVCVDKGTVIPEFTQWYEGQAPDIGAYEGDRLVEGPPFYIMEPPGGLGYKEKPRITRHRIEGNRLTIFYSWNLKPETLSKDAINLIVDGNSMAIDDISMGETNREVIITASSVLENRKIDLDFNTFPVGENGETATLWGSTLSQ